jgi:hypothetical protein
MSIDNHSHTLQLLRQCLSFDEAVTARLAEFVPTDWSQVCQIAVEFRLSALLYWRLKEIGSFERLPERLQKDLWRAYLTAEADALWIRSQLSSLLSLLRQAELSPIVLKGAYLAEYVYDQPGLRWMSDFDLLLPKADLPGGVEQMSRLGYQPVRRFWLDFETATSNHLPPLEKTGLLAVELHWALTRPDYPFEIDMRRIWQRARPANVAGIDVLALCREDLLLHLCLHAVFQHRLAGGLWFLYDIAICVKRFTAELAWETLIQRAEEWRARAAVYLCLRLAQEWFGAPLPAGLLASLQPADFDHKLIAVAEELVFSDRQAGAALTPDLASVAQHPSQTGVLASYLHRLCLPRQVMAQIYPAQPNSLRIFLYYPVRWADLFNRYIQQAWKLLRRDQGMIQAADQVNRIRHNEEILLEALLEYEPGIGLPENDRAIQASN